MKFEIRLMTDMERMYSYTQSAQIMGQTGCIGHLRADMNAEGCAFFSSWEDHKKYLKTDEFREEFDSIINSLRYGRGEYNIFENRTVLANFCYKYSQAVFENGREYGFRLDTKTYAYMLRLNPNKGEYNVYMYCYRRDWLEEQLEQASKGIRFIDSKYNTLFTIPDGGHIRISYSNNEIVEKAVRFIDDYHIQIGNSYHGDPLFHICEFAERMEQIGAKVEPVDNSKYQKEKNKSKGVER